MGVNKFHYKQITNIFTYRIMNTKKYNKEYYQKNKERINEAKKKKIFCECGRELQITHMARHLDTHKHHDYKRLYNFIVHK